MSFYRESPSRRSPYARSPARNLSTERQLIEQEIHLKNAYRSESEHRRVLDQMALLQIKLRKTDELELKIESLIKQNSLLAQENEHISRELAERRYQLERYRSSSIQLQERDSIKTTQLAEINRSLEIEIDLLKKERLESNKLYQSHIQKLEIMLEQKLKEVDILGLRCNDLLNEKEVSEIKFEEERNKLKNMMVRTSHEKERELEYTRQKNSTEKFVEIETLKKNYASQILLLEDEINKLKGANSYKVSQFENQLLQNKNIRTKYQQEVNILQNQNNGLREKILKLEELNRSEVVNIEVKYNDIQKKGANNLIHGHEQEIKILISEIDRLNWLLKDKNAQIQNMIREKKQHKFVEEQRELSFRAEIDTLKNKLLVQQEKSTQQNQELSARINKLSDKLLRESQNYQDRVNGFKQRIDSLENQVKGKQNQCDNNNANHDLRSREYQHNIEDLSSSLERLRRELSDSERQRSKLQKEFSQYKETAEQERLNLNKEIHKLETQLEQTVEKSQRHEDHTGDAEKLLNLTIQGLKKTIATLEQKLSQEQKNHSKQMKELSNNIQAKIEKLQVTHKKTIIQVQVSRANEIQALSRRIQKLTREKEGMEKKLEDYVRMYDGLQKYFAQPDGRAISEVKSESNVYEVLQKSQKSTIHIF